MNHTTQDGTKIMSDPFGTTTRILAAMDAAKWNAVDDPIGATECLLADLIHWCDTAGVDFDDALAAAHKMYREELAERPYQTPVWFVRDEK